MTAKEYLSRAIWIDKMINSKLEQLEEIKAQAESTTVDPSQERVSGGNRTRSPMEDATVKLADLSMEISEYVDEFIKLKREIQSTINKVSDFRYKLILEMRYLNNKDWASISGVIDYDTRYTMKLHGRALNIVDKILKEDTKRHLKTPL